MRSHLLLALAATSAALVAQAPAQSKTLMDAYAAEIPALDGALKEYKSREAITRLEALIPAEAPKYAKPTLDELKAAYGPKFTEVFTCMTNHKGLAGLHMLLAKAYIAEGQWEKAKVTLEKAQAVAKGNEKDFREAVQPVRELWAGMVKNAEGFKATNAEQLKTLEAKEKRTPEEDEWLGWYRKNLPVHENNISSAKKINDILDKNLADLAQATSLVETPLSNLDKNIQAQAGEIKSFNEAQAAKKPAKKVEGNKPWVDAVLNKPENVTKLEGAKAQVEFLNRLLVLDPENKVAVKAVENLKAGKEPFAKDVKAPAKAAAKAPKGKKG